MTLIGYLPYLEVDFTFHDSNNPAATTWGREFIGYIQKNGTTDKLRCPQGTIDSSTLTDGSSHTVRFRVTPGQSYDGFVALSDGKGGETPMVPLFTNYTVAKVASGDPVGPIWGKLHQLPVQTDPTHGVWDNNHNAFDHGTSSFPVSETIGSSADPFGAYTKPGVIHRLHMDVSGQPGATNLLYNPTGTNGYTGWTRMGSLLSSWNTDTYGGGRFYTWSTNSFANGQFDGWKQQVSVGTNQEMVMSGLLELTNALPTGCHLYIDVTDGGETTTLGSAHIDSGTRVPEAFTFNTSGNSSVMVRFYIVNNSGVSQTIGSLAVYKLQLEYGSQPSAFVDHYATAGHTKIFDGSQKIIASSTFNTKVPNMLPWTSDLTLNSSSSGVSPNITMTFWYDNGSGADATIYNPDGSSINVGHTTSSSGYVQLTGVSSGQSIYALMYYTLGSGMTLQVSKTPFTISQITAAYADGGYVAINATTAPLSGISGGSTASTSSGGSGPSRGRL